MSPVVAVANVEFNYIAESGHSVNRSGQPHELADDAPTPFTGCHVEEGHVEEGHDATLTLLDGQIS
jgi:hypothetical protein